MENLTPEQRWKIDALMAELETLPTPEAITESGKLRCPIPRGDTGNARMRLAIAGGIAAQRLLSYIEALEDVDDHRGKIGQEIFRLRREGEDLQARGSLDAANPLMLATHYAGRQEVDYHFFAICVGRIERFLPKAAKAAGHTILEVDRDLLATYRPLRDYYEHLEDRMPGGSKYAAAEAEEERDGELHIRMGLNLDSQGRVVMGGVTADVTLRGLADVRAVLRNNWEKLKPSALTLVRNHFMADPSHIPNREVVSDNLLLSLGVANDELG